MIHYGVMKTMQLAFARGLAEAMKAEYKRPLPINDAGSLVDMGCRSR
jgi:hypothetical protein